MYNNINISPFINADGKIIQLPAKRAKRLVLLDYLLSKFSCNTEYIENDVNAIIDEWHTFGNCCLLRRELIDNELLRRTPNGTRYWKENGLD